MNPHSLGKNFNFAFNPFKSSEEFTDGRTIDSMVEILTVLSMSHCFFGDRKRIQNEIAWMTGTTSIILKVSRGVNPKAIRPAQPIDPIIPADPVPDDHDVITFLMQ